MTPLVARILDVLATSTDESAISDAMLNAAFLFEKERGLPLESSWTPEVVEAEAFSDDFAQLKQAVIQFVERNGFGTWTLSKCDDLALKPLFVRILREQLTGDTGELFQAMIALSQLGEPVFGKECSRSILDESHNRKMARAYLQRFR